MAPTEVTDDYYAILKVTQNDTFEIIKKSYRTLARQLHPDKNPGSLTATQDFQKLGQAWETLQDAAKRRNYDAQYARIKARLEKKSHKPETPRRQQAPRQPEDQASPSKTRGDRAKREKEERAKRESEEAKLRKIVAEFRTIRHEWAKQEKTLKGYIYEVKQKMNQSQLELDNLEMIKEQERLAGENAMDFEERLSLLSFQQNRREDEEKKKELERKQRQHRSFFITIELNKDRKKLEDWTKELQEKKRLFESHRVVYTQARATFSAKARERVDAEEEMRRAGKQQRAKKEQGPEQQSETYRAWEAGKDAREQQADQERDAENRGKAYRESWDQWMRNQAEAQRQTPRDPAKKNWWD